MKRILVAFFFSLAQLLAKPVFAADGDVGVTMQAFKVVATAQGVDLVPTEAAQPGDTIEYQVTYRNTGKTVARNVVATLPVPAGAMAYLADSAAPAAVTASVDGKEFAPVPLRRIVVRDGRNVTDTVPPAEYRALRWTLGELRPGQSATVKSRMRMTADTASNTQ